MSWALAMLYILSAVRQRYHVSVIKLREGLSFWSAEGKARWLLKCPGPFKTMLYDILSKRKSKLRLS